MAQQGTITCSRDDFVSILGEGIHTGLRKAAQSPPSSKAWNAINDMPAEEWDSVLQFVVSGLESMDMIAWGQEAASAPFGSDMPLSAEDGKKMHAVVDSILAVFSMGKVLNIELMAYKGVLNDREVLIIAATEPQGDGNFSAKPLCVVWDEVMHDAIELPHATKVPWSEAHG